MKLVAPELPEYLRDVDGILLPRNARVVDQSPPDRFAAELLADEPPPIATVIHGLESGRFGMRERFERAWANADEKQRATLRSRLEACWCGVFGHRTDGAGKAEFLAWSRTFGVAPTEHPAIHDPRREGEPFTLTWMVAETGHVPVDHDSLLYHLADIAPPLHHVLFADTARFDPDELDEPGDGDYTLHAWLGAVRIDADIKAFGDYRNTQACIAFLNALLAHLDEPTRFAPYDMDGEQAAWGAIDAISAIVVD